MDLRLEQRDGACAAAAFHRPRWRRERWPYASAATTLAIEEAESRARLLALLLFPLGIFMASKTRAGVI